MNNDTRQSNFELLRLLAQFFIVFYHILLTFVYPNTNLLFYKTLWLPLHVGVILFVLISGYFTIKPTTKGFIKLFAIFTIYSIPEIIYNIKNCQGVVLYELLYLSKTHFWFVKTYLFLYLLSPVINGYLKKANNHQLIYIIFALFFVSQYMAMTHGDNNMSDGKNVVNFMFIYSVGYFLKEKETKWKALPTYTILTIYFLLNILLVGTYVSSG